MVQNVIGMANNAHNTWDMLMECSWIINNSNYFIG